MNNISNKGAALSIALMVVLVVGMLGMTLAVSGVNESRMALRRSNAAKAFWLTEAGIQAAYQDVVKNDCKSLKISGTQTQCGSCAACPNTNVLAGSLPNGDYSVTLTAANKSLSSTGSYPSSTSPVVQRRIQASISTNSAFAFAAFAQGQMTFNNNAKVDSFNSANGAYGGANVGTDGNIGTNGTSAGIINLSNNVTIKGSASTGANGTVVTSNGAAVTGSTTHTNHIILVPVTVPTALTSLVSAGVLSIAGHTTKTLAAGNYKYSQINMANGASLVINGDTQIYITGDPALAATNNDAVTINAGGSLKLYVDGTIAFNNNVSLNNLTMTPSKFMIYSTYDSSLHLDSHNNPILGIDINNNASFYGTIYAPKANISLDNNAAVFGAMVGNTVNVSNNDQVHFDEALRNVVDPNATPIVTSWQEI